MSGYHTWYTPPSHPLHLKFCYEEEVAYVTCLYCSLTQINMWKTPSYFKTQKASYKSEFTYDICQTFLFSSLSTVQSLKKKNKRLV